jgi:hypothetical protein
MFECFGMPASYGCLPCFEGVRNLLDFVSCCPWKEECPFEEVVTEDLPPFTCLPPFPATSHLPSQEVLRRDACHHNLLSVEGPCRLWHRFFLGLVSSYPSEVPSSREFATFDRFLLPCACLSRNREFCQADFELADFFVCPRSAQEHVDDSSCLQTGGY